MTDLDSVACAASEIDVAAYWKMPGTQTTRQNSPEKSWLVII